MEPILLPAHMKTYEIHINTIHTCTHKRMRIWFVLNDRVEMYHFSVPYPPPRHTNIHRHVYTHMYTHIKPQTHKNRHKQVAY